jgi:ribonucleotide reductase alpha subunit
MNSWDVVDMHVTKRSGQKELLSFDKILKRVKSIGNGLQLNYSKLVMKIIEQLFDGITTTQIDELTAEYCVSLITSHTDYGTLADRIIVSNHQKNTSNDFYSIIRDLYSHLDDKGNHSPRISHDLWTIMNTPELSKEICTVIDYERDFLIDYFGFKTLERAYLLRINGKVVERPQHMWMRVAIGIHGFDIERVKETYHYMSNKYFTHATPTLYNAGTPKQQLSSCFLVGMEEDSLNGIYNTLKDCANISKWAGGIGLHIHNVRATTSKIYGTNGQSSGIVPMLKIFNDTARYVNQGGKRNGSFAIYLEPWHGDIEAFLDMKKNHGDEDSRARDLFYGLWIPDLFMERVKSNALWSLFCPNQCPGLADVYGEEFNTLYKKYEDENRYLKQVNARALWYKVLDAQMETGTPYLLYKDSANAKSNQKNLGTIQSSNLCTEIIQYSDPNESSVCNLASIALPQCIVEKTFDYEMLHKITKIVAYNLNKIIDINFYPTEKTRKSNFAHRPIGIGIQGLADVFILLGLPFDSAEARQINKNIFETMYHAALECSNEIAIERKLSKTTTFTDDELSNLLSEHIGAYSSFEGSPAAFGQLQFDMWANVKVENDRYDWLALKRSIVEHGLRNSLLLAPMPTASTSQILGFTECFEPITSNIYTRRTLAGEFIVPNKYLMNELLAMGLWTEELKNNIIANKGSVQQLTCISKEMRDKYKIVWEIPMKVLIDMSADRGAFICQSQSLNLWLEDPTYNTLTSMHFYAWRLGLKTGIYYLRRKAKHQAQQFTIEPEKAKKDEKEEEDDEVCEMCSA